MQRREALSFLGAAALAPLLGALSPAELRALQTRVGTALAQGAAPRALTPAQMGLVTALADTIIPKTDTPGAVEVGVPAFIDLLVAEWYSDEDKAALLAGLDALDARCREQNGGKAFGELDAAGRAAFLTPVDAARGEKGSPEAAYRRLKDAIIFGWQTSRPISELNPTPIIPGRFDGCIPLRKGS